MVSNNFARLANTQEMFYKGKPQHFSKKNPTFLPKAILVPKSKGFSKLHLAIPWDSLGRIEILS